ncbi:MAG TPA: protoporphyrinogen oxidase [Planctomycetaceae bacterium]|nr:protoporphyrinogen oxidase [Planctomycetaceae bacterium]HRF02396.1 protoporphyrinogen oxidase [Pirellulaceae bacterium]
MSIEPSLPNDAAAPSTARRWGVIGGGITGLTAAWELMRRSPGDEIVLFEASERLGGILGTHRIGEWLVEQAADMMVTEPDDGLSLFRELELDGELLPTDPAKRGAMIWWNRRLYRIPDGFSLMAPSALWPIARTGLLSWRGKWRLARERSVPPRAVDADEDFESFAIRRCGPEAYERLIQPLVSGIYTADPRKLSMRATSLARFVQFEQKHGSLTRGLIASTRRSPDRGNRATGARYGMFVAPRAGMQQLIDRLAERLGDRIRTNSPVTDLRRIQGNASHPVVWQVTVDGSSERFDGIVLAAPAPRSATLLRTTDPSLARRLAEIEHASCAVVVLGLRRPTGVPPVFGVLVPNAAGRPMIAAALTSHKFPGRAPADGLLVRVFFGGALNEPLTERPDDELIRLAIDELRSTIGLRGDVELSRVVRWTRAMPQYHVGHLDRVAEIERSAAAIPGLALAGNALRGVGIPDCVRAGRRAARRLLGLPETPDRSDQGVSRANESRH